MQKTAMTNNLNYTNVEKACMNHVKYFHPNCNHTHLFLNDEHPSFRQKGFFKGKPVAPWLNDKKPYCNNSNNAFIHEFFSKRSQN